jgi:hypothetical protein
MEIFGNLEGRRLLGCPTHKHGVNIKLKLLEIWCECMGQLNWLRLRFGDVLLLKW